MSGTVHLRAGRGAARRRPPRLAPLRSLPRDGRGSFCPGQLGGTGRPAQAASQQGGGATPQPTQPRPPPAPPRHPPGRGGEALHQHAVKHVRVAGGGHRHPVQVGLGVHLHHLGGAGQGGQRAAGQGRFVTLAALDFGAPWPGTGCAAPRQARARYQASRRFGCWAQDLLQAPPSSALARPPVACPPAAPPG